MKKPSKPNKPSPPSEPKLPEEYFYVNRDINYYSLDNQSLQDLIDSLPPGTNLSEVKLKYIYAHGDSEYSDGEAGLSIKYSAKIKNSFYDVDLKAYENRYKKYQNKLKNYNNNILKTYEINNLKYEQELKIYTEFAEKEELKHLEKRLLKLQTKYKK